MVRLLLEGQRGFLMHAIHMQIFFLLFKGGVTGLVCVDTLSPSQHFFSHVGTFPWLNQY